MNDRLRLFFISRLQLLPESAVVREGLPPGPLTAAQMIGHIEESDDVAAGWMELNLVLARDGFMFDYLPIQTGAPGISALNGRSPEQVDNELKTLWERLESAVVSDFLQNPEASKDVWLVDFFSGLADIIASYGLPDDEA
jgi:hypothetical protein